MGGAQGRRELTARLKTIMGIDRERACEEGVVAGSESRADSRGYRPRAVGVGPLHRQVVLPAERALACESLENNAAKPVEVTPGVGLLPADLFW